MLHQVEKSYWKTLYRMHVCENIHLVHMKKKIDRYVKDMWLYMNICYRYIWYEKQGNVFFVIQYQCNVSVNSPWISINSNSTLLGSSCSPTMTLTKTKHDMICKSRMTADATSGREKVIEKLYIECICVKISILTYEKIDRYVTDIYINIILTY